MALDTTVGGAASDSYCSLAEANAYHAARGSNSEWSAMDDATKELHLKWACRNLDVYFDWKGTKNTSDQALEWPRYNVWDKNGYPINTTVIPKLLKNAQAEFAFQLKKEDWTQGLGSVVDEGVEIGPLKTTREMHRPIPSSVAAMVQTLVNGGAGAVRSIDMVRG